MVIPADRTINVIRQKREAASLIHKTAPRESALGLVRSICKVDISVSHVGKHHRNSVIGIFIRIFLLFSTCMPEIHRIQVLLHPFVHMILEIHDKLLPACDLYASGLGYVKYFFDIV